MKEQHILLPTAKLLLEKGFDEFTCGSLTKYLKTQKDNEYPNGGGPFSMTKGEIEYENGYFKNSSFDRKNKSYQIYSAPTQTIVQKWLRDTHKLHIEIVLGHDEKETWYDFYVYKIELGYDDDFIADSCNMDGDNSYENCLETALQEALKLI